ncbi:AAA family ATPase [Acinetobacter nosocomialis]|uniref:AAA family ATPase n=1 Tax=Acinetobacter nosocomialis TaxID=106654 RepID=UPI0033B007E8
MIFALCGSHRTGKTTLAQEFAKVSGAKFIPTSITRLQKEIGFNSANQSYSFDERMKVQEYLIERLNDIYEANYTVDAVADRSPIDLMAYALIHAGPDITQEQSDRLMRYINRCAEVTRKHCVGVLLVQPGIELKEDAKSAVASVGFIEHLNSLIFGLINDERLSPVPMFYIPRNVLDLRRRVAVCSDALARSMVRNIENGRHYTWNRVEEFKDAFFSPSTIPQ